MVITELLQNAVEHGYAADSSPHAPEHGRETRDGTVAVTASRGNGRLVVTITDDGHGLPEGFDLRTNTTLGLTIVTTLVESEMLGSLSIGPSPHGRGARAVIDLPLQ
jgi:two-component sensor histidine kinase